VSLNSNIITSFSGVDFHHPGAFWFGAVSTTVGVTLHLPMYISARAMGYQLAGMPVDTPMVIGMFLIVIGFISSFYGLYPLSTAAVARSGSQIRVRALDDAKITKTHVALLVVMAIAVTIDVMKPTTLAFVVPGMAQEYGLRSPLNPTGNVPVALLPLSGISGRVLGSFIWGSLGDRIEWCRTNRHRPVSEQRAWLSAALRGHYAYYSIRGNYRLLQDYRHQVAKIWHKWLARRTRGKPFTWDRFCAFLDSHALPAARIIHRYTSWNESLA
jgi:hypothetical protein